MDGQEFRPPRWAELVSRAVFLIASIALLLVAASLIVYGGYRVVTAIRSPDPNTGRALLDAVGYVVISIAVFDVSKYLLEEEVLRAREMRKAGETRRSLTRFISTIMIAMFLEALVTVFEAAQDDIAKMLYPTLLLFAATLMVVALGVFQRLTASVEKEVGELPGKGE